MLIRSLILAAAELSISEPTRKFFLNYVENRKETTVTLINRAFDSFYGIFIGYFQQDPAMFTAWLNVQIPEDLFDRFYGKLPDPDEKSGKIGLIVRAVKQYRLDCFFEGFLQAIEKIKEDIARDFSGNDIDDYEADYSVENYSDVFSHECSNECSECNGVFSHECSEERIEYNDNANCEVQCQPEPTMYQCNTCNRRVHICLDSDYQACRICGGDINNVVWFAVIQQPTISQ